MFQRFKNRAEGGRALAKELSVFRNQKDVIVLALPRGGVPVAYEVAKALNAPLDIFLVRKLGVPGREELAFGAIASGSVTILNKDIVQTFNIPDSLIEKVRQKEQGELKRREKAYRSDIPKIVLRNKKVIIVDDGLATGATMRAAVKAVRIQKPRQIIIAVPVASFDACEDFCAKPEELCVCLVIPSPFYGVGMWYRDFAQTSDDEVGRLLEKAKQPSFKKRVRSKIIFSIF